MDVALTFDDVISHDVISYQMFVKHRILNPTFFILNSTFLILNSPHPPVIKLRISLAKVMIIPPAKVRNPFAR